MDLRATHAMIPVQQRIWGSCLLAAGACAILAGCLPSIAPLPAPPVPRYGQSSEVRDLPVNQREQIAAILTERCGNPEQPRLLGDEPESSARLRLGRDLYGRYCVICHGVTGDGAGIVADLVEPRPRDFRRGVFKFQSTPYGARPLRGDLARTITRGMPGTLMPAFGRLTKGEIDAVVDYVLALSRRGELERELAVAAAVDDELTSVLVDQAVEDTLFAWREAERQTVEPLSPQPEFTAERVNRGRDAFVARGCAKCHGEDGKGQTAENLRGGLRDYWGQPTRAADLTTGRLKGGGEPVDIYRRILGGINGTPMPSFKATLWAEPESIWDLTAYVLWLGTRQKEAGGE
jgi:mono/diheme cytochrome c family protein